MNHLRQVNASVVTLAVACWLAACAANQAPPAPLETPGATINPAQPTSAATAAASPLPVQPSRAATTPIPAQPTATLDKAAQAKALADRLTGAPSDQAHYDALLAVMQALAIGVYTPDGQPVVRGAERGPRDFYLYDFELRLLAASLARQDSGSIDDLAANLSDMGPRPANQPLTVDALWASIQTGTRAAAQQPTGRLSLVPLLVRELGLRKSAPYDLLQAISAKDITFDALQQFLIVADLTLPLVRQVWPIAAVPSQRVTSLSDILTFRPIALQDPCEALINGSVSNQGWYVGTFPTNLPLGDTSQQIARQIIQRIHDRMLRNSIKVWNYGENPAKTHYGHAEPGKPIEFKIMIVMLDAMPDVAIRCGLLMGLRFPHQGPIPYLEVAWNYAELASYGNFECESFCRATGPDGVATLVFHPKQEVQPYGLGEEIAAVGSVKVIARYDTVLQIGNGLDIITPIGNTLRFEVSRHVPPQFDFTFESTLDVFLHNGPNCTEGAHAEVTMPELIHLTYADGVGYHGLGGKYHYETTPRGAGRCYLTWSGSGDQPFEVVGGRIEGDVSLGQVPQITLPIRIGDSIEKAQGPSAIFPPPPPNSFWSLWWKMAPRPEQAPKPDFTIRVTDWEYVGSAPGKVFARKRWPSTCGGKCTEETNMSLILTPP